MKTYYFELLDEPEPITITEDEILKEYWEIWQTAMIKKFGANSSLINKQNCIDDWVVINWAWEKRD